MKSSGQTSFLKILVAEDNDVNQQLMRHVLKRLGYEAEVVSNGLEAINAVERTRVDVLFMDVQMPQMDGLEATRRIVGRWNKSNRPEIIALTAGAKEESMDKCFEAGMDGYLTKPVRPDQLQEILLRISTGAGVKTEPAPPDTPMPATLEESVLERLRQLGLENNPAFFVELLETYIPAMDTHAAMLFQAYTEKDAKKLHYAAHSLKGSSLNIGATSFGALCETIESHAKSGSVETLGLIRDQFEREFESLRQAVAGIQQRLKKDLNRP